MKTKIAFVLLLAIAELRWGDAFDWIVDSYPIAAIRNVLPANINSGDRNGLNPQ